jgi:SAM-dependent methyltransferase
MKDYLFLHLRDLPYFRALIRAVEATYYQDLPLPAPVYDVGCGDGHFASLAFDREIDVGLDPWHDPIHQARGYGGYRELVEADGAKAPFPGNSFASAISNSVLEHIPHVDEVLAETARVLRPGAPFYFCVPNPRYLSELSIIQNGSDASRASTMRIGLKLGRDDWRKRVLSSSAGGTISLQRPCAC